MKKISKNIFLIYTILSLIISAPPPIQDKIYEIKVGMPNIISNKNNTHLSPKKSFESEHSYLQIQNSTAIINFKEDFKTIEHQLILIPKNLGENRCFSSWYFSISLERRAFEEISSSCKITNK